MWQLDYKESWVPKNWCFWTGVLEKTLESPLDWKVFQPNNPKGNQSWIFIGRTDAEAETLTSNLTTWCEELTYWKRPWWWERLKAGGEGDNRGQNGCMASPTQWTWVEQAPGGNEGQGTWCAAVHGIAKSRIRLSDSTTIEVSFFKHLSSWKDFPFPNGTGAFAKNCVCVNLGFCCIDLFVYPWGHTFA